MTQSVFFGLQISSNQDFRVILALTQLCEKLGYDAVFYGMDDLTRRNLDCWTVLAALASHTEHIRLGPMMSFLPHRHPSTMARAITTLDVITNGRIEWRVAPVDPEMVKEWGQHGVALRSVGERIDLLDEALNIFKKMCVSEEPVTFEGKYFQLQEAYLYPRPVQQPHPPITIPASGARMLGVVANHAQVWIGSEYFLDPEKFEKKRLQLQEICVDISVDFQNITPSIELVVIIDEDGDDARQRAKAFCQRANLNDEFLVHHAIGTPKDCIQVLDKWVERGVKRFDLWFEQPPANQHVINLFGEHVLSHFK